MNVANAIITSMKSKNQGFTILRLRSGSKTLSSSKGFTIVELLVVIVVIGILAAITIVSYSGIRQRANLATLQSDLKNASTQLEVYKVSSADESYPIDQPSANLKSSSGTTITYNRYSATSYCVEAINNTVTYHINSTDKTITSGNCLNPADWITIGTQTWAKYNLNVGTMVPGTLGGDNTTNQTDNSVLEKYCYQNDPANCTAYGGLYQWDEAMQYVTTEGTQGICPAGSHIPSDNDWKILEMQLGMTEAQANTSSAWRGVNQGTQLKSGGSSGLNMPLAGGRYESGYYYINTEGDLWSSTEYNSTTSWNRDLDSTKATVYRDANSKIIGLSVRCLKN